MHWPVVASHSRTSWSSEPEASRLGLRGWKRTTHGVRRCPDSTRSRRPVVQQLSFTVWSPLQGEGFGKKSGRVGGGVGGAGKGHHREAGMGARPCRT